MPNMDMSSLGNIMKDNAEAITSTNQVISDTVQSITKRGADSFQKNTSEMFNTMKEAASARDVEQISNCQQNYWRSTVEHSISTPKKF